jgi:acyl-CoA reductase-like NAD-dependent aldehyde dehydrogenase
MTKIVSINPATGEFIREFEESSAEQLQEAMRSAAQAQKGWAMSGNDDRINALRAFGDVCKARSDEIVALINLECGVPLKAAAAEVRSGLAGIEHYASRYESDRPLECALDPKTWGESEARIDLVPHGVIGHIGVWNYPFWQTMASAIPALMTGNTIVYKPSELATMSGLLIADMMRQSHLPQGVFVPLIGGAPVGQAMVRAGFDAMVFTGDIETGKQIIRNAGILPLFLELSGNDAGIVCSDVDPIFAARGVATGTFSRAGQVCIRIKRVYVEKAVADRFIDAIVDIASRLDVRLDVGPLIREEARQHVAHAVQEAIRQGAELLAGGKEGTGPGFFYEPTVLVHSNDALDVVRKETFGPVCPIRVVRDVEEAVALANATSYGLGATVWTSDTQKGAKIASRLDCGNVWVNDSMRALPGGDLFQGWKQSGIPSCMTRLDMFRKKRTVIINRGKEPRPAWFK